jgi:hypothetical protein
MHKNQVPFGRSLLDFVKSSQNLRPTLSVRLQKHQGLQEDMSVTNAICPDKDPICEIRMAAMLSGFDGF